MKNFAGKKKLKKKKKKPSIKLNYFKLLKNITSYNNQDLQNSYDSDWTNNLIINLSFCLNFINNKNISNNLINLLNFNLFKFIKI